MTDLFLKKHEILFIRLRNLKLFSSVDATRIGLEIFYRRADRTVREWASEKDPKKRKIRRLEYEEKLFRGLLKKGNQNLAWYEIVDES